MAERYLRGGRCSSRRRCYEPFGLAVLEAAQAGCALVLSDIPTFRELWDGAAMFVPPGRRRRLAAPLEPSCAPDRPLPRSGQAARERAGRYSLARMARACSPSIAASGRARRARDRRERAA